MSPSERRRAILDTLCEKRYETTANLAAAFGVSERTIRSDLVALSCSYPIQTIRGRYGGGITLAEWFHPEGRVLSPKQESLLRRLMRTLSGEDLLVMRSILALFGRYG